MQFSSRAAESESESLSRSHKEFLVESESEGIFGGVGVGRNFWWSRSRKEF
jgi:hypothetical protein